MDWTATQLEGAESKRGNSKDFKIQLLPCEQCKDSRAHRTALLCAAPMSCFSEGCAHLINLTTAYFEICMLDCSAAATSSKGKEGANENGKGKGGEKLESTSSAEDIRALRLGKVP